MSALHTLFRKAGRTLRSGSGRWWPREVRCYDGPSCLHAVFVPAAAGLMRVDLEGSLTPVTAAMIERWFVALRDDALAVEVCGVGLTRSDPHAIPALLRIARGILRSGASFRCLGFGGVFRERLVDLAPALITDAARDIAPLDHRHPSGFAVRAPQV